MSNGGDGSGIRCGNLIQRSRRQYKLDGKNPQVQNLADLDSYLPALEPVSGIYSGYTSRDGCRSFLVSIQPQERRSGTDFEVTDMFVEVRVGNSPDLGGNIFGIKIR